MTRSFKGHYAGFVSRLIAYVIDVIVISVSLIAATWFVNTATAILNLQFTVSQGANFALTGTALVLFVSGYFVIFWSLTGQTPGKLLLGVRIVTLDGRPLSFKRSVIRFVGYLLSALAFYVGFLWILIDNRRQGWHDKLARTCVIYTWNARPGDLFVAEVARRQESRQRSE